jgi:hypothetical protein
VEMRGGASENEEEKEYFDVLEKQLNRWIDK